MWLTLALICLGVQLAALAGLCAGWLMLRDFAPPRRGAEERWPSLSIVVAGRDEERAIEACVRSLLALDYPDFEVIAVDDRSVDATGAILDRLAACDARLKVVHVRELPRGWLGKNHGLHLGAAAAGGELLLFTDADVVFSPDALQGAVAVLEAEQLDHLALGPAMRLPGAALAAVIAFFGRQFLLFTRPWRARRPQSACHIGVGAFNLVRRKAYDAAGGHARIALRPDDDIKLGKILKQGGFRQEFRHAPGALSVTWYASVGEFVRGLEKNVLAGADYRGPLVLLGLVLVLAVEALPWAALALGDAAAQQAALAAIAVAFLALAAVLRGMEGPPAAALLHPYAVLVFVYACVRSIILAYVRGGITWRGTFYPLDELRRNEV